MTGSSITDCIIKIHERNREDKIALFRSNPNNDGSMFVQLDDYAIIPKREYLDLVLQTKGLQEVRRILGVREVEDKP